MKKNSIKKRKIRYDAMDLDHSFVGWIIPRLHYFEKNTISHPPDMTFDEWLDIVRRMRKNFEDYYFNDNMDSCKLALKTFTKYFHHFWM